jgi:hypothetical protein
MTRIGQLEPSSPFRSERLEAVARAWQEILRLTDWDVWVFEVPAIHLEESALAQIYIGPKKKAAQILVLNVEERRHRFEADNGMQYFPHETQEASLVHELLHIYLEATGINDKKKGSPEYIAMEQMVNALAHTLMELRYSPVAKRLDEQS